MPSGWKALFWTTRFCFIIGFSSLFGAFLALIYSFIQLGSISRLVSPSLTITLAIWSLLWICLGVVIEQLRQINWSLKELVRRTPLPLTSPDQYQAGNHPDQPDRGE